MRQKNLELTRKIRSRQYQQILLNWFVELSAYFIRLTYQIRCQNYLLLQISYRNE
jgi:hypothetical protein